MAWMMVRTNWAPKMKKNVMKLKELSALGKETPVNAGPGLRQRQQDSETPFLRCVHTHKLLHMRPHRI